MREAFRWARAIRAANTEQSAPPQLLHVSNNRNHLPPPFGGYRSISTVSGAGQFCDNATTNTPPVPPELKTIWIDLEGETAPWIQAKPSNTGDGELATLHRRVMGEPNGVQQLTKPCAMNCSTR